MQQWQDLDDRERRAHLAALADDDVVRLARARARLHGMSVSSLLGNWVMNGWLPRPRKLRIEGKQG